MLVRGAHGRCKHRTQEVTQSSFLGQTFHSSSVAGDQLQAAGNYTAGSGNGSNASMLQLPPSPTRRLNPLDAGSDCYTLPLLVGTKNMRKVQ